MEFLPVRAGLTLAPHRGAAQGPPPPKCGEPALRCHTEFEMETEALIHGLLWFVVFLFSTTLHEAAHALAALRGGDPTDNYT
jgi:hypothetical protein